jgi:hydroxylamine reductase (hybrid-cluster protein)
MTSKEQNIHRLYKARTAHLKWVNTLRLLVSGFDVDKKTLTPILQDSEFGKWFYDEAMQFSQFNSKIVLDEIEIILESMYNIYTNIYAIYFTQRGSIKKILGLKSNANKYEIELSARYYEDIVKLSDQFKSRFKVFESQLLALGDAKHNMVKGFSFEQIHKITDKTELENEDASDYHYGPRSR